MSAAELLALSRAVVTEEPGRLMDAKILVAIDLIPEGYEEGMFTPRSMAEQLGVEHLVDRMENSMVSIWRHLPHLTTSLDAAVKLFPGTVPASIPSEPRKVAAAALLARAEVAAWAEAEAEGIVIDTIGGNCPIQAEGGFDGELHFYFRGRGQTWQFHIAENTTELLTGAELSETIKPYTPLDGGSPEYAAGWMSEAEAIGFIIEEVKAFRARRREALA